MWQRSKEKSGMGRRRVDRKIGRSGRLVEPRVGVVPTPRTERRGAGEREYRKEENTSKRCNSRAKSYPTFHPSSPLAPPRFCSLRAPLSIHLSPPPLPLLFARLHILLCLSSSGRTADR